ncbi:putative DNA endonuclease SmrA [Zhongshania aliphaticivorans]|uniref:Putative DNA endonuclease SmrA n=1 Tax=Zhongshania aliphaticivorans TaxID=1470434 RepID=A0A5S9N279_9GAMM|nr:DNA endonuclease SmrA [Zhongshania aliphaticivorans]CAA0083223.1 putative DNA endonuclease SmrA [Zhongshania aliphaticivorans]CAA0083545.1 putative DNA endonuclease SmrA [Zhongshania aliphaticivorans]
MSDEDRLFAEEMVGVKRLVADRRVVIKKDGSDEVNIAARRAAATADSGVRNFLSTSDVELLDPYYVLEFQREGVQHGVFRRLKQGKYAIEARLDLHKMSVEQARIQVFDFISEAMKADLRTIMIVHGRGHHSESKGAVIKSYVNRWLPELEAVQGFCSAQPQHGGAGAVYIMLKKSERKKQENRDRFTRGRSS